MDMSAGSCQNVYWGMLVEDHSITVLLVSCHANWGPCWSCSTLCWCQQQYCKPHNTSPMVMQANSEQNHRYVCSIILLYLQVWIFPHPPPWRFQRRRWSAPHSTALSCPAQEYLPPILKPEQPPQDLSTVQHAAQRAGMHCSDISITVAISLQTEAH